MTSIQDEVENNDYIQNVLNPILEPMVLEIFLKKPSRQEIVQYMIEWLRNNGNQQMSIQNNNKQNINTPQKNADNSFSDQSDYQDDVVDLPEVVPQKAKVQRGSVSAEVYGQFNRKISTFQSKVFPKNPTIQKKLQEIMNQSFLYQGLEDKSKKTVEDAFEPKQFKAGETVIKQGDDGDYVYVVYSGQLSCYVNQKLVKKYEPGENFGELALLYNAPRAATIVADTDCLLYGLDRETFNYIVKEASIQKRAKYEAFLNTVEILSSIHPDERLKIADVLKKETFQNGEYVVRQGEQGDKFYLIESGNAIATKNQPSGQSITVFRYKQSEYFGELALLKNTPRAANVIAEGTLEVVSIDRHSFKRLLGPLDEILKRNFSKYEKYLGQ